MSYISDWLALAMLFYYELVDNIREKTADYFFSQHACVQAYTYM